MTEYTYAGLHTHSQRSFLDGYSSLEGIAERAKSLGQKAVALTDHQEVGGHWQFQKECLARDIKPIFGCEGYLVDNVTRVREEKDKKNSHITLLAKNETGLKNLWAWTSEAYEKNFYYRALQDWEGARHYSEGLYASDGCLLAYVAQSIIEEDTDRQHRLMGQYLDIFGDNFYMELHTFQFLDPSDDEQRRLNREMTMVNQRKVELANQYGVPLVVVNDAHYTRPEDWVNHDLVWAMNTRGNLDQTGRGQTASWMMDNEDILFWMSKHGISREVTEEAIKNTSIIADSCNVEIKSELRMPRLTPTERDDLKLFLKNLEEGFNKKVVDRGLDADLYFGRMKNEVQTITDKKFEGYFNVVADYHKWAKYDAAMMTGAARGSAGGSLVAYLMDITEVDPIKYDLDFDRFLVKERKGLPDIDLDYPQSRREEVKQYLAKRYGEDHICGIGTLSTLQPKGVLADLSRAMDIPREDSRAISKVIEDVSDLDIEEGVSWNEIVQESDGDLAPWARKYPELFEKMGEMVGLVRQSGTHAAGTLVSSETLEGNLPTRVKGGHKVSAFTGDEVEEMGFVKFDILGIRHLDTLQNAKEMVKERHGVELDYYSFGDKEFRDPDIWKMFETAQVNGIFQAETAAMSRIGAQLKPKNEEDLSILYAINRPGVVRAGLLQPFLDRWNGLEEVHYDHPMMEEIVGGTMGILVFQEQILATVKKLAGFSGGEADQVRKILGKRQVEAMQEKKDEFISRALNNEEFVNQSETGDPRGDLENIWKSIEASGAYSFNKSHSVAYAILSAWEVWTKHHYFPEFITALLQTDPDKISKHVAEARRNGMKILPPDINESGSTFTLTDDTTIRYGLGAISHVGTKAVSEIIKNRPYSSLEEFVEKNSARLVNKKVVVNLIRIGAFDSMGERSDILQAYYDLRKIKDEVPDFTLDEVVYEAEMELVGVHILKDPMDKYRKSIERVCASSPYEIDSLKVGRTGKIGGQITKVKEHTTKGGRKMAFIGITWDDEFFDVLVFPEAWDNLKNFIELGAPVATIVMKLEKGCHLVHLERLDYIMN